MNYDEMLHTLEEHHRRIIDGIAKIERHCAAAHPGSDALARDRQSLTNASLSRSQFVSETVVPALLEDANTDLRSALSDLLVALTAKRLMSNAHIAKWIYASIEADWAGYCSGARDIWAMMKTQIERERRVLITQLRLRSADKKRASVSRPGEFLGEDA
jgi:hypothetical protein